MIIYFASGCHESLAVLKPSFKIGNPLPREILRQKRVKYTLERFSLKPVSVTGGSRAAVTCISNCRVRRAKASARSLPSGTLLKNLMTFETAGHNARPWPCRPNTNEFASGEWKDKSDIINLPSGGLRRRSELADRSRRLRIMCKYGLAPSGGKGERRGKGRGGGGTAARGEYDGDDFEPEVSSPVSRGRGVATHSQA